MQKTLVKIILMLLTYSLSFSRNSYIDRNIGFGIGIGNPIIYYAMSFPYVDVELGYGGTNGINLSGNKLVNKIYDLNLFVNFAIDLICTISLIEKLDLGFGFGIEASISSMDSKMENVELGTGLRVPIAIFYDLTSNIEFGCKLAPSFLFISIPSSLINNQLYQGFKINILGGIFIKYYI